jgi:hypothetical protein
MQHDNVLATSGDVLAKAIRSRKLIKAVYNSAELELAPHLIFLRNEPLYVGAVNPHKKIRSDEEPRLGHFKIEGLSQIAITETAFEALPAEACALPREDDQLIFAAD